MNDMCVFVGVVLFVFIGVLMCVSVNSSVIKKVGKKSFIFWGSFVGFGYFFVVNYKCDVFEVEIDGFKNMIYNGNEWFLFLFLIM